MFRNSASGLLLMLSWEDASSTCGLAVKLVPISSLSRQENTSASSASSSSSSSSSFSQRQSWTRRGGRTEGKELHFSENGDPCAKSHAFIKPSAHFGSKSCVGQHVRSMSASFVRDQSSSVKHQTLCLMCSPASIWTSRIPIVLRVNVSDVLVFLVPALTLVVLPKQIQAKVGCVWQAENSPL